MGGYDRQVTGTDLMLADPQEIRHSLIMDAPEPAKLFSMELVLCYFRVRDQIGGKWRQTRYCMSDTEALERYGAGNYERLDYSREVRVGGDCPQR